VRPTPLILGTVAARLLIAAPTGPRDRSRDVSYSVRIGAYRCRRFALKQHQLLVTCKASARRYVRFRAVRNQPAS
jgi:hypothetical protein